MISVISLILFFSTSIFATEPKEKNEESTTSEISISSDEAEIKQNQDKTTSIIYEKNVVLSWKELQLKTEKVILSIQNKEHSYLTCPQKIHLTYKDLSIKAAEAECDIAKQQIRLTKDVSIEKKSSPQTPFRTTSHAQSMIINLKSKKTRLFGIKSTPVKTTIFIKKNSLPITT
ncbi:LPS export ABC transporter periplasmic protein LptC [Candidatus Babeliales bacterium]|nr:LPS export ABC transporter periplasmic protein LptC [Candidatus Babeliales bacterium]